MLVAFVGTLTASAHLSSHCALGSWPPLADPPIRTQNGQFDHARHTPDPPHPFAGMPANTTVAGMTPQGNPARPGLAISEV